MLPESANQITVEDLNVMRKSRKVILERDQMMEDVIDSFIMKLNTEEEAVYLDREDSLSE
jgi:energy-converting hydrogenase A subunit M